MKAKLLQQSQSLKVLPHQKMKVMPEYRRCSGCPFRSGHSSAVLPSRNRLAETRFEDEPERGGSGSTEDSQRFLGCPRVADTVESIEVAFGINHLFLASGNWKNGCEWRVIRINEAAVND